MRTSIVQYQQSVKRVRRIKKGVKLVFKSASDAQTIKHTTAENAEASEALHVKNASL